MMSIADQLIQQGIERGIELGTRRATAVAVGRLERLLGLAVTPPGQLEGLSSEELEGRFAALEEEFGRRLR